MADPTYDPITNNFYPMQVPQQGLWGSSPLADLAAALAAAAGAVGAGYNIAGAAGGGGGGRSPKFGTVPGTAHYSALGKFMSRVLAQNANTMPPTFKEFLESGGTAKFDLKGADQFTPHEAVRLGLVSKKFGEVPYYTPGQGELTPDQIIFLRHQRKNKRRAEKLLRPSGGGGGGGGGGGKKKDDDVQFTVGVDSFGGRDK